MMLPLWAVWVAAPLAVPLAAPDPELLVTVPAEMTVPVGRVVRLTAQTPGKFVRWASVAEEVDLVPFPDGKTALFCSATAGRFVVLAWTASGDVPGPAARCVVVVGANPSPSFAADLKALIAADKPGQPFVPALAQAYREAAALPHRADLRTTGELAAHVQARVQAALPPDVLGSVRRRIAVAISDTLPTDPGAVLDAATRARAADVFTRIATHLEAAQ